MLIVLVAASAMGCILADVERPARLFVPLRVPRRRGPLTPGPPPEAFARLLARLPGLRPDVGRVRDDRTGLGRLVIFIRTGRRLRCVRRPVIHLGVLGLDPARSEAAMAGAPQPRATDTE